jgi:hypothetical protein
MLTHNDNQKRKPENAIIEVTMSSQDMHTGSDLSNNNQVPTTSSLSMHHLRIP